MGKKDKSEPFGMGRSNLVTEVVSKGFKGKLAAKATRALITYLS